MPIATFVYSYKSLEKLDGKLSKISNNLSKSGSAYFDRLLKTIEKVLKNNDTNSLKKLPEIEKQINNLEKEIEKQLNPLQEINTLLEKVLGYVGLIKKPTDDQQKLIDTLTNRLKSIIEKFNNNNTNQSNNESYINKISTLIGQINDSLKHQPINSRTKSLLSDYILKTDWSTINIPKDRTYLYSSSNLNRTETIGKIESSLSKIVQDDKINDIEFIPYTDIGIVRDSIEYFLKHHSFPGSYRDKAIELLKKLAQKKGLPEDHYIVNYNDLKELKKQGIASKFNVGFMQNNMNSDKLDPSWNAIPKNDANQSGDWFQKERWDFWTNGENAIDSKDLTITFGPFANAFWHQAYLNNYDEFDLAQEIFKLSEHYGTKSFDFYFAPPYNRKSDTSYGGSTRLLAGALKIVKEKDKEFKIRLSIVSPKNGVVIPGLWQKNEKKGENSNPFSEKDHYKLVGDAIFPFFEFTRFLGVNFNLNLVTAYENIGDVTGKSLEKLLENTHLTWKKIINYYLAKDEKYKISNELIWNRMSVTPWIGRRAEKATHKFLPTDAALLREFAKTKNMHSISMFYITRDHPSIFESNGKSGESEADKSPIDQNLRSGTKYNSFTYSKIFNGIYDEKDFKLEDFFGSGKWAFDYEVLVSDNKDELIKETLSKWKNENGGKAPGTDIEDNDLTKDGNNISDNISKKEKLEFLGKHVSWYSANPLRWGFDENNKPDPNYIKNKEESNNKTKYSPYVDMGLWPLVDYNDLIEDKTEEVWEDGIVKGKKVVSKKLNLDHLTLAFVQQNNSHDSNLDLTFAGYYSPISGRNAINDDYLDSHLKTKILQPFKDKLNNLTISYGGFATGDNNKNPWHTALALNNNDIDKAAKMLANSIKKFNEDLSKQAGQLENKIYNVDFDIEGNARNKKDELKVLFKAMAILKKEDQNWNFSLTLPVLPSGLVANEANTMLPNMLEIYKAYELEYKDLPTVNIMAMDYGVGIYNTYLNMGKTNFDMAKLATTNTRYQYYQAIKNAGFNLSGKENSYEKIAVTPMIGVNDHKNGVFTLEDAKEFYNWVHSETKDLNWIGIWSINDDNPKNGSKNEMKSLTSHGLNYLRKYDFSRVFTGDWDEKIKKPSEYAWGITPKVNEQNWFTNLKNLLYN